MYADRPKGYSGAEHLVFRLLSTMFVNPAQYCIAPMQDMKQSTCAART